MLCELDATLLLLVQISRRQVRYTCFEGGPVAGLSFVVVFELRYLTKMW